MKKQFDRFVLTSQVAQGAGGSLFAGVENLPGGVTRAVAVKVLPALHKADPNGEKRFVDECRVMAALAGHPHVVTFYGMGITDGTPWVAMEAPSGTLAAVLGEHPADPREVARVVEHVAHGLAALHGLTPPLVHNRLRPASVLLLPASHYKVTDFGLAAPANAEPTLGMDSIRYAAPELLSKDFGRPGPATDLYALGHVAYEMALGGKLHRAQFPAVIGAGDKSADVNPAKWQAWHHSIPTIAPPAHEVIKGFPPGLGAVIAKLMAKPLAARYQSAHEVLGDLRVGATSMDVGAGPAPMDAPITPARSFGRAPTRMPPAGGMPPPAPAAPPPMAPPRMPTAAPAAPAASPGFAPAGGGGGNERYFVRLRNTTSGPFDIGTLQRMARQGQLSRLHQLSTDQRNWRGAGSVDGIFG